MDKPGTDRTPPPSAVFMCGACGNVAATATLVSSSQNAIGTWVAERYPGYAGVSVEGGPVGITRSPVPIEAASAALTAGSAAALFAVDTECAPFWCPECAASYCRDHYQTQDVWDCGFFDCVRGTCPAGHTRVLID